MSDSLLTRTTIVSHVLVRFNPPPTYYSRMLFHFERSFVFSLRVVTPDLLHANVFSSI